MQSVALLPSDVQAYDGQDQHVSHHEKLPRPEAAVQHVVATSNTEYAEAGQEALTQFVIERRRGAGR